MYYEFDVPIPIRTHANLSMRYVPTQYFTTSMNQHGLGILIYLLNISRALLRMTMPRRIKITIFVATLHPERMRRHSETNRLAVSIDSIHLTFFVNAKCLNVCNKHQYFLIFLLFYFIHLIPKCDY